VLVSHRVHGLTRAKRSDPKWVAVNVLCPQSRPLMIIRSCLLLAFPRSLLGGIRFCHLSSAIGASSIYTKMPMLFYCWSGGHQSTDVGSASRSVSTAPTTSPTTMLRRQQRLEKETALLNSRRRRISEMLHGFNQLIILHGGIQRSNISSAECALYSSAIQAERYSESFNE
jgi:hypothetical protein